MSPQNGKITGPTLTASPFSILPSRVQLGKGRISKPFIVKARFVSKAAEEKIKAAGGAIKLVA